MDQRTCGDECENRGPRGGICKKCHRRRHYLANREHELATMAAWRKANRDYDKARQRQWYAENTDYFVAKYRANRTALLARKKAQRAANPGGETHHSRNWRKRNAQKWALRNRENQRRRRGEKVVDYAAILAEHGMWCHICETAIETFAELHMDHVIPLAKGGPHATENIRPAHALCNLRKGDSII